MNAVKCSSHLKVKKTVMLEVDDNGNGTSASSSEGKCCFKDQKGDVAEPILRQTRHNHNQDNGGWRTSAW